ncbi:MAG: HD-GYP domain-containing protein [Parasphingorhabdus sp.]|uniref:HD-GYP domain-containing protein n=2 Tax=Parasphingorhabdus sp. TaxID=2709688 RepID=UPI0032661C51
MLRKIPTSQLGLGMFVESMEGSWFKHPFWRSRFLLTDQEQLQQIVSSDVAHVTIDESRGQGLAISAERAPIMQSGKASVRSPKPIAAKARSPVARPRSYLRDVAKPTLKKLSPRERAAEVRKASGTIKRSKAAVMNMFEDARLGNSVKSKTMAPLVEQISKSVNIDPTIILNIARLKTKDEYTYLHSVAVCALMVNLARKMGAPEAQIQDIGMAGLLHDVGKTSIPDSILSKPGKLDEKEWVTVRNHPQRGHDILSASEGISDIALEVCLRHHEKMDGTGYPGKIPAGNLSIFTRMSAICDVYDAITSQRSYNSPLSASQALAKMQSWSGHFDQLILRNFIDSLGILPVGTLVRLNDDELAIVIGESPKDYSAPIVRSFYSLDKGCEITRKDIDTRRSRSRKVLSVEEPEKWGFSDWSTMSAELLSKPTAS